MLPGITSKLSEKTVASTTTITQESDLIKLTGSTTIQTIRPNFGGGFSGVAFVVCLDGAIATGTSGNIAKAVTIPQNQVCVFVYSKKEAAWYPGAIS